MSKNRKSVEEIHSITQVRTGLSTDLAARNRRYMISMLIRLACFGGGLIAQGSLRWILLGSSLVLPWVAVIMANAGRENGTDQPQNYVYEAGRELNS